MDNFTKTIIAFLVIAIIVVGYLIFTTNRNIAVNDAPQATTTNSNTNNQKVINVQDLFNQAPKSGASGAEFQTFSDTVLKYSVPTTTIEFNKCNPYPTIARIEYQKPIQFINHDETSHKLVNGNVVIDLPAKSIKSITPAFRGTGIYIYACDTKLTGAFFVLPAH